MAVLDLLEHHGPILGRADRDLRLGRLEVAERRNDGEPSRGGTDDTALDRSDRRVAVDARDAAEEGTTETNHRLE